MLRLARLTDYAILIAASLAERDGDSASARDLAQATGIPWPTVVKLLKRLTASGVLRSSVGRSGGYALARSPDGIGLIEVIEAVEGPLGLTECSRETGNCWIQDACVTCRHWLVINRAVRDALQGIRVADLTASAPTLGTAGTPFHGVLLQGDK